MDGKSPLKQRLARFFRASALLRNPCNHHHSAASSSAFSSSAGSRLSISTDIAVAAAFVPRHDCSIDRSLSMPARLDVGATNDRKKKKILSNGYGFTSDDSSDEDDRHYGITEKTAAAEAENFYQSSKKKAQKNQNRRSARRRKACNGFAVTKRSRDPYTDFCDSIAEMIVAGQIFGVEGLESLLGSYLSLNSPHHHPVILRAFADVFEVLFGH